VPFELPKQENLQVSIRLAREKLAGLDAHTQALRAGCELVDSPEPVASLRFVGRQVELKLDKGLVVDATSGTPLKDMDQALILHYLVQTGLVPPLGELITVSQMPDAVFYGAPFRRRAEIPLERAFGTSASAMVAAGAKLGGEPVEMGDGAVEIQGLPLVPVTLVMWEGDEEFPAQSKVLLRENVISLLPAEDAIMLASQVVYAVLGAARG
jgi:hypothetical protein